MQHRGFLKLAFVLGLGVAAGTALPAPGADAAPLSPAPIVRQAPQSADENIHRAVTTREETDRLAPQQVRWGHHWHHHHWHRHWGWHHRHWHHRHWGWHHHWRHHHWRHW